MHDDGKLVIVGGVGRYYDEITFLRGFSILTIVIMHYLQHNGLTRIVNTLLSVGGTGVHIFFFCSGFGLYLSFLNTKSMSIFRRFFKIYIPYIIIVGISALIPYMYDGNRANAFWAHLLLYKMFLPMYEESFGPFWYISTLFQFYFTFPLLVCIKEHIRKPKVFSVFCLIVSMSWWIFSVLTGIAEERIWGSFFLQYLWEFALGMVVSEFLYEGNQITIRRKLLGVIAIFGLGMAGVIKVLGGVLVSFNDVFASFGYGALALYIYSLGINNINKFVKYTSAISYELYLVHMLVFIIVLNFSDNRYFAVLISFPASYLLAHLYTHINRKINNLLKNSV